MTNGNKTLNIQYRFLSRENLSLLYETNLAAFADYSVPLQMTKDQFENHIAQNAIDIDLSVGAFADAKLVGFTLNGFGIWNGKQTVYDAGTGIIPEFRNKGIGRAIFGFLLPKLKASGTDQMLLEVLSKNKPAIHLYKSLGFTQTRRLHFFEQTKLIEIKPRKKIKIRQIEKPVWTDLESFCDGIPSWQFSNESIGRKLAPTNFFGAYLDDKCVGYSVLFPTSGVVPQIAVDKKHRQQQIASMLLARMQRATEQNKKLRLGNVDEDLKSVLKMAEHLGFKRTISQIEMILKL